MRYKKGTKVEVLTKRELPSGAWRRAEIISGNGYSYNVKYEVSSSGATELVERVPRKVIRPFPPVMQGHLGWVPGDIVEVIDNGSWKLAQVTSVADRSYFSVRILGSFGAFKVHKSDVRLRQCWENDRWVVIGKDVETSDYELLKEGCLQSMNFKKAMGFPKAQDSEESTAIQNSKWVTSAGKKRGLQYCSPTLETCHRIVKKIMACDEEGKRQQLAAINSFHLQEKVDAVASPQNMMGEKYMHASLHYRPGLSEVDMEKRKPYGDVGYFCGGIPEPSDASVCSSSGSNNLGMLNHFPSVGPCLDVDSSSDDADSSCWSKLGENRSVLTKDLAEKIHELELYAYRTTMKALYSSGPITWEQEEMMTNLRMELHISNDEHLLELRNLLSFKLDILSCVDAAA